MKYVLDVQSELNYIIKRWYNKYQLHVSAITLTIIRLYSTSQNKYTIYVSYLGGRDLVYSGLWHGLNILHNQIQNK